MLNPKRKLDNAGDRKHCGTGVKAASEAKKHLLMFLPASRSGLFSVPCQAGSGRGREKLSTSAASSVSDVGPVIE